MHGLVDLAAVDGLHRAHTAGDLSSAHLALHLQDDAAAEKVLCLNDDCQLGDHKLHSSKGILTTWARAVSTVTALANSTNAKR